MQVPHRCSTTSRHWMLHRNMPYCRSFSPSTVVFLMLNCPHKNYSHVFRQPMRKTRWKTLKIIFVESILGHWGFLFYVYASRDLTLIESFWTLYFRIIMSMTILQFNGWVYASLWFDFWGLGLSKNKWPTHSVLSLNAAQQTCSWETAHAFYIKPFLT